jgi:hypothetical protein
VWNTGFMTFVRLSVRVEIPEVIFPCRQAGYDLCEVVCVRNTGFMTFVRSFVHVGIPDYDLCPCGIPDCDLLRSYFCVSEWVMTFVRSFVHGIPGL